MRRILIALLALPGLFVSVPASAQNVGQGGASGGQGPLGVPEFIKPGNFFLGWAGYTHSTSGDYDGGYAGAQIAMNGKNLWVDGGLWRLEGSTGWYEPSVNVTNFSAMIGYRKDLGPAFLAGYVGPSWEMHQNAPNGAELSGGEGGVKVALELNCKRKGNFDCYGLATYSSAFDTVFAFARPGYWVGDKVVIGPDLSYYRIEDVYEEFKPGGYVGLRFKQGGQLFIAGGFVDVLRSDEPDGWYANATYVIQR